MIGHFLLELELYVREISFDREFIASFPSQTIVNNTKMEVKREIGDN